MDELKDVTISKVERKVITDKQKSLKTYTR
jgi:hypothetical protein